MSDFVLDCSVAMAWWFADEVDDYADRVLDRLIEASAVVPSIWPLEVANALLVAERRKRITPADSRRIVDLIGTSSIAIDDDPPEFKIGELIALGRIHGLSAYDAAYLELAIRAGLPMATGDARLRRAAEDSGVEIFARA